MINTRLSNVGINDYIKYILRKCLTNNFILPLPPSCPDGDTQLTFLPDRNKAEPILHEPNYRNSSMKDKFITRRAHHHHTAP